jgi:hypothetical protein
MRTPGRAAAASRKPTRARRRRHGIDVTFDADNLGIGTDVIEKVVSNPRASSRSFAPKKQTGSISCGR